MNSLQSVLLLLINFLLIFACSSPEKETPQVDNSFPLTIVIDDIPMRDNVKLTDLISDYEYVPLETSEKSLVGDIHSMALDKDRIFIQEFNFKKLHIFNRKGDFINAISAKGQGPGEFTEILGFTLDRDKQHVIIAADFKIMTFDYNGNFIKEFKLRIGVWAIGYTGEDKLLIYSGHSGFTGSISDSTYYQTVIVDLATEKIIRYALPYNSNIDLINDTGFWRNISSSDTDDQYLSIPYKDTVWLASGDSISVAYIIDFGEDGLPDNYEDEYLSKEKYSSSSLRELAAKENWRRLNGAGITYSKNILYFYYSSKGKYPQVFYDLNTRKSFQVKNAIENDLDGSRNVSPRTTFNGKFVSLINPSTLKANVADGKVTEERIIQLAESLKEEDNPVIRLMTFKPIQ